MKKPKLGTGARFKSLAKKLASKGAKNPKALAAFIGRKKYGKKKMTKLSSEGKKHERGETKAQERKEERKEGKKK